MMSTFIKVMFGYKKEINSIIPDCYLPNIYKINYEKLKEKGIVNLLFDVDNTIAIVDDINLSLETVMLFEKLKKQEFNILLISNNHERRVRPVADMLNVPMIANANKPEEEAYKRALNILKATKENTAAIGDQLLSDIAGAKKYGLFTILVDQLSTFNNAETKTAKNLQTKMMKKMKKYGFDCKKYY